MAGATKIETPRVGGAAAALCAVPCRGRAFLEQKTIEFLPFQRTTTPRA